MTSSLDACALALSRLLKERQGRSTHSWLGGALMMNSSSSASLHWNPTDVPLCTQIGIGLKNPSTCVTSIIVDRGPNLLAPRRPAGTAAAPAPTPATPRRARRPTPPSSAATTSAVAAGGAAVFSARWGCSLGAGFSGSGGHCVFGTHAFEPTEAAKDVWNEIQSQPHPVWDLK